MKIAIGDFLSISAYTAAQIKSVIWSDHIPRKRGLLMGSFFGNLSISSGIITIILLVITVVLIFSLMSTNVRVARLEKRYRLFMKGTDAQSLDKAFVRKFNQLDKLSDTLNKNSKDIIAIQNSMKLIFSKYGIEKYDAFDDVGGKLSFALAMLDHNNSGIILNAVHSRDNCFLYLKEIVKGESYIMLSQEEVEALRKAVNYKLGSSKEE